MVQQLFSEVERLKAEVKRLRGRIDAFSAGGQIIQGSITGGSTLPPPTPGHILVGISDTQWGKVPLPAWGWDEGGEGGGGDGDPGPPGPAGPAGAAGSQGPMGPAGAMFILDPDEPEEAIPIPGPVGPTGATGATGPAGAVSPTVLGVMHDEIEDHTELLVPPGQVPLNIVFYPIIPQVTSETLITYNVNDAVGRVLGGTAIPVPFDLFGFSHFRLYFYAQSSEAGQTVIVRMCKSSSYASPVSTSGDLTVTNTGGFWDSGIVPITVVPNTKEDWSVGVKGSNTTVDLAISAATLVLFRFPA